MHILHSCIVTTVLYSITNGYSVYINYKNNTNLTKLHIARVQGSCTDQQTTLVKF